MTRLKDIPFTLDTETLMEAYRIKPGSHQADAFQVLVSKVQEKARPKVLYRSFYIDEKADDAITLDGVRFTSRALRHNLDSAERVFVYIATCGTEVGTLAELDPGIRWKTWLFFLQNTLLEKAVGHLKEDVRSRYRIKKLASMNPGSGDAGVWPLSQQKDLFALLGDVEASIGVKLTDGCMLMPAVSVSGILFPTTVDYENCRLCRRENCPGRKAPFNQEVWSSIYDT
jgi:hypothetical protein